MAQNYYGSICISDIMKTGQARRVTTKSGEVKIYANVQIVERREPSQFGDTHFISVAPKKENRVEGVNYIVGDLKPSQYGNETPTPEQIEQAPAADLSELPF